MTQYIGEGGLSYPDAMELIGKLNDAGFEANVTGGGIWVLVPDGKLNQAQQICAPFNVKLTKDQGRGTTLQSMNLGS